MPKVSNNNLRLVRKETLPSASDESFDEESKEVRLRRRSNKDKVNRWIGMLRNTESINETFIHILGEIEDNITRKIETFQRDIYSTIENNSKELAKRDNFKMHTSTYAKELKEKLKVGLPIDNLITFEMFDENLEKDIEKRDALKSLFNYLINENAELNSDISTMVYEVMSIPVLICYSGAGKRYKGQVKRNFSATNLYLCIQDALVEKHRKTARELNIRSKVSRWISYVLHQTYKNNKQNDMIEESDSTSESDD